MKESRNVTMKDVAREAGVALGTVSKVVNGKPVGEEYLLKVNAAIEKLNYQVNSYAQGLKAEKTYTVALLLPNTKHPYFGALASDINRTLAKRNYRTLLCCTDYSHEQEQEYITMAHNNKVDGIIGLTYSPDLKLGENASFISIDRIMSPDIPCVASDNFAGGQMAAEKLADLGCKNVAFLRIGSTLNNEPNKRKAGFENGCLLRKLNLEEKIINDIDQDNGIDPLSEFEAFLQEHLHDGKLDFDGIFCVTDMLAYDVIKLLNKMGLNVPEDVQVIGFDGTQHFGDHGYTCSTIVQPTEAIAEMAVDLLLSDRMTVKPPLVCLPVQYAYGGTTKE